MEKKKTVKIIEWYQKKISRKLPTKCRYIPTCSQYGKECFEKYNILKAFWLTYKHICFCNPFANKGKYE